MFNWPAIEVFINETGFWLILSTSEPVASAMSYITLFDMKSGDLGPMTTSMIAVPNKKATIIEQMSTMTLRTNPGRISSRCSKNVILFTSRLFILQR